MRLNSRAPVGARLFIIARPCRASFRDAVSFRQRLPHRAQTRHPRKDTKSGRFFVKTYHFYNQKIEICHRATPPRRFSGSAVSRGSCPHVTSCTSPLQGSFSSANTASSASAPCQRTARGSRRSVPRRWPCSRAAAISAASAGIAAPARRTSRCRRRASARFRNIRRSARGRSRSRRASRRGSRADASARRSRRSDAHSGRRPS